MRGINPVYKKELKLNMRTWRTAVEIMIYNLFLAAISLFAYYIVIDQMDYGFSYEVLLGVFQGMMSLEFGLVLFLVPAYTAGAIAGERERQTLEILLTTKLKPFQIVVGKLLSSISLIILLVISSLPVLAIIFSVGGASIMELFRLVAVAIVTSIYIGSFGILFSTIFKKTMPATVMTYLTILFLCFGTMVIVVIAYELDQQRAYDIAGYDPSAGPFAFLMLFNPIISYIYLVFDGYSTEFILGITMGEVFNHMPGFFARHIGLITIACQLLIAFIFLRIASRKLNPTYYKNKKIQKKAMKARKKAGKMPERTDAS